MTTATDLREQVTFAKRVDISDEYGGVTAGWQDQFTVRARIWPRLGGETVIAARLTGAQPVTITVRESPVTRQIQPQWKVTDTEWNIEYAIQSIVDPDQSSPRHDRYLDLLCQAGVAP